jgi:hypothetical protein
MEIIKRLKPERTAQIIKHLESIPMQTDKSTYAKGRKIQWIGKEPMLFAKSNILESARKAYVDRRIVEFCRKVMPFKVDYILISYSGEAASGINWHRDASYGKALAGTINLGTCRFGLRERSGNCSPQSQESEQWLNLTGGEVITFDCKHPHCAVPSSQRWAIHCWSDSGK